MSSKDKLHQASLKALSDLLNDVQPIINKHIAEIDSSIATYLLTNYSKYLKINLESDLEQRRVEGLTSSPFDEILNSDV